MFNGDYRSSRRPINLSSKRKQPTKSSTLELARARRQQRQLLTKQTQSCIVIQRRVRGNLRRRALSREWTTHLQTVFSCALQQQQQSSSTAAASASNTLVTLTRQLELLLRMNDTTTNTTTWTFLEPYSEYLSNLLVTNHTAPLSHWIVTQTLEHWDRLPKAPVILNYVLDVNDNTTRLHKDYNDSDAMKRAGVRGRDALVKACLKQQQQQQQPSTNTSNTAFLPTLLPKLLPNSQTATALLQLLTLLSCQGQQQRPAANLQVVVECLESASMVDDDDDERSLRATIGSLIGQYHLEILDTYCQCSPLENLDPVALIRFLHYVLHHYDVTELLWAVNLRAAGQDPSTAATNAAFSDDDSDSDNEDDEMDDTKAHAKSVVYTSTASTRVTKMELQTLAKLDKLQQSHLNRLQQSPTNAVRLPLERLVDPNLWQQLISVLDTEYADRCVSVLELFLQATTGLYPRQSASSSALLNKLAFSNAPYKLFALYQKRDNTATTRLDALSLFCDLWSHVLIALKDVQFLQQHANHDASNTFVQASEVIQVLKEHLYEFYWTKPVVAADVQLNLGGAASQQQSSSSLPFVVQSEADRHNAQRARLMLSGTKLWNSLYERWCRLGKQERFCDESLWWFPNLSFLASDHAVARGPDPMDVDSDSDMEESSNSGLADAFKDPKMARILSAIPQVLPFDRRVELFDLLLKADKRKSQDEAGEIHQAMMAMMRGREPNAREHIEIRRDQLFEDSMRQLNKMGSRMKRKIQISFINQHGAQEAGIDGGGVFKEFIDDLIKDAFSMEDSASSHRLFSATPLQTLTVNPDLIGDRQLLSQYEFLGRVLGKSVYESILVEPQFCLPFLNQFLGKQNSMEDLKNFDADYYRNLNKLLSMSPFDLESMGLSFELTYKSGSSFRTVDLMPNGRNIAVNKQNVIQYVYLVSHHRLNVEGAPQTRAFLKGFRDLIPASWVRLFSANELQKLISGDDSIQGIDVDALKKAMQYAAGYNLQQPVVQWFWEIIEELDPDQQHKFLKFMTSCSRQPLLGFESMEPAPCVQQIRLPDDMFRNDDTERILREAPLPTSSTCMNLLKLPNYRSKPVMKRKLIAAIESGAGFELT